MVLTDANAAGKNFDVLIEPQNILLGPTYYEIDRRWMHKAAIKIRAKPNTLPGIYVIGFDFSVPDADVESSWAVGQFPKYFSGAGEMSIGRPRLRIYVTVK